MAVPTPWRQVVDNRDEQVPADTQALVSAMERYRAIARRTCTRILLRMMMMIMRMNANGMTRVSVVGACHTTADSCIILGNRMYLVLDGNFVICDGSSAPRRTGTTSLTAWPATPAIDQLDSSTARQLDSSTARQLASNIILGGLRKNAAALFPMGCSLHREK